MFRNILISLDSWSLSPNRRSLVLRGARQVGKTWAVREFAKRAGLSLVEVNFERQPSLRLAFDGDLTPDVVLTNLEIGLGQSIDRQTSLLFLDEIQDCPRALTALKHFTDAHLPLRVIAAGSYLGLVEGKGEGVSQPIGYVDELSMFPMGFDEFALAANLNSHLLTLLRTGNQPSAMAHQALLAAYRNYLFVGGMPAIVDRWFSMVPNEPSIMARATTIRTMQKEVLVRYKADFAKYYPRDALNIARTWELVAEQLAKSTTVVTRFTFKEKISGKRDFNGFANYFTVLEACGLIHRSFIIVHPAHPIKAHKRESFFKCYFFDSGLLLAEVDFAYQALIGNIDASYKGPIAENFVACELTRNGLPLFCYEKVNSSAEIEFIVQLGTAVIPIEVKNNDTKSKSLDSFNKDFPPPFAIKLSNKRGEVGAPVRHYPIYLTGACLRQNLQILESDFQN